jgi:hypothetical protein
VASMPPFERVVGNIIATYAIASEPERAAGLVWYASAHKLAASLAHRYGITVDTACAIFAVISPRVSWDWNVTVATLAISTGHLPGGYIMPANQAKVNRLLAGDPALDTTVDGRRIDGQVRGPKVGQFFLNILTSGRNGSVTIDVHAANLAVGAVLDDRERDALLRRKVDHRNGYEYLTDGYIEAAYRLGISPSDCQAGAWLAWRELLIGRPRGANALVA